MGGADSDGRMYDDNLPESPMSFEEIERPPLRKIDKYTKAECPCLSQRYTVAVMACLGFVISFGMRCNMGMAKLQLEHGVSFADLITFNWTYLLANETFGNLHYGLIKWKLYSLRLLMFGKFLFFMTISLLPDALLLMTINVFPFQNILLFFFIS